MNNLIKLLKKKRYKDVFETLQEKNYTYSLDNIAKDFSNIDEMNMYCYLLYVISREETCEHYLLICNYLMFSGTFFHDIYTVIYWHLNLALKVNPRDYDVLIWIIEMFYGHPDSPFSKIEFIKFAEIIILIEPENLKANEILKI